MDLPVAKPHNLLTLASVEDDGLGEELQVVWEIEPGAKVIERVALPEPTAFDSPDQLDAFLDAVRWGAASTADHKNIQSPFRSGIEIEDYQLDPVVRAIQMPRVNLLIADDVGLGKTIEAGLIASELLLRRRVREIVVACPPSMVPQWKDELEARFGLTFEVLDRNYLERVREERGYSVNPWTTFPRFLVSHKLLIDETYAAPLRDWLDNLRPGSLLILDEAHHAAPSSGSKYAIDSRITKTIRDLAPRFEHRLFLSATPHNGHSNSFSALLELMDPQRFTRGVKVRVKDLDPVMVRRLKDDVREVAGGFPKRLVTQIDLRGLPEDASELKLSKLLDQYRQVRLQRIAGATKRKQAETMLLISGLQQRLLSSIEAFARTLAVHRRTMEKVWAASVTGPAASAPAAKSQMELVAGDLDADDDRSDLGEAELAQLEDAAIAATTEATAGAASASDIAKEKDLLTQMEKVAHVGRGVPDARIRHLVEWMRTQMCEGVRLPGQPSSKPGAKWSDLRILIFTEYEDTKRYVVEMLRAAIAGTDLAENRIEVFHGPTPPDKREAIKRAFNAPPKEHPVRILVATDAAREGLNLQAHCWNLFHIDVPWNPSRLEQRNGRIDRKLQPNAEVYCHYFVYTQRAEDRVLKVLVEKSKRIRDELGSLSQVLEGRLTDMIRHGIRHADADKLAAAIDAEDLDKDKLAVAQEELEASRERQDALRKQVDTLRNRINDARKWIGLDNDSFRDALSCSLEMLGAAPLKTTAAPNGQARYAFPNLDTRHGADPTWADTLDTLRALPKDGEKSFNWRKESPIRPVVFEPPNGIDDDIVQLHLEHRVVQRLLGRFLAQGFVHHDLSRACLAHSADAIPRVVLLGRLSLYGKGAVRLHEEVLTLTARWAEAGGRRAPLAPYGREAEAKTMELLEQSLKPGPGAKVPPAMADKLLASIAQDIDDLLPHLESRGLEAKKEAEAKLNERGRLESEAMRKILEEQKQRVIKELGKAPDPQMLLDFSTDEKRQLELNRRAWDRFIVNVDGDLRREPARILDFYNVASFRIEPVGLAYLWPVTG
jgi:superfamily II DNA or RNA helicase